jgi:1-deoxy-D-xylulose-5-phosphate synthase
MITQAAKNDKLVAVTAAMPEGTGLAEFAKEYPDRFFDVGIAEQHGVTFAAGMASEGLRPVVAIYSTFLQRAYDQIIHDVCIDRLPVIFAIDRGGLVGEDGPTHHGQFDLSYLRSLPNLVVMAPKDENELCRMLVTALSHDGPIAMRYPRGSAIGVPLDPDPQPIPIGQAEIVAHGDDILILAVGRMVNQALKASIRLLEDDLHATVVNCRFVKPLDTGLLPELCTNFDHILTVEENVLQGGFGSAILELLVDNDIQPGRIKRLGLPDRFVEHGAQSLLLAKYQLDSRGIAQVAREMLDRPSAAEMLPPMRTAP